MLKKVAWFFGLLTTLNLFAYVNDAISLAVSFIRILEWERWLVGTIFNWFQLDFPFYMQQLVVLFCVAAAAGFRKEMQKIGPLRSLADLASAEELLDEQMEAKIDNFEQLQRFAILPTFVMMAVAILLLWVFMAGIFNLLQGNFMSAIADFLLIAILLVPTKRNFLVEGEVQQWQAALVWRLVMASSLAIILNWRSVLVMLFTAAVIVAVSVLAPLLLGTEMVPLFQFIPSPPEVGQFPSF